MKKILGALAIAAILSIFLFVMAGFADEIQTETPGEAAFNKYCLMCHPGGSNIFNPAKTLRTKDLEANNIKNPDDIINLMRNPGPQMTKFDKETIPDNVAKEIAEYVLKNFK